MDGADGGVEGVVDSLGGATSLGRGARAYIYRIQTNISIIQTIEKVGRMRIMDLTSKYNVKVTFS